MTFYLCLYGVLYIVCAGLITLFGLVDAYDSWNTKEQRRNGARRALFGWAWLPVGIVMMLVFLVKVIAELFRIAEIKGSK